MRKLVSIRTALAFRLRQELLTGLTACLLCGLVPVTAAAQSSAEEKPEAAPKIQLPLEVFRGPRARKANVPAYPTDEGLSGGEGWVNVAFMVDANGKPYEASVVDSTGDKNFESAALKAVQASIFDPATLNGTTVESALETRYLFVSPRNANAPGARSAFVTQYLAFVAALKANDQAAAQAAMAKMQITNLYEDAFFGQATALYNQKWGDEPGELKGLERALAWEGRSSYLPPHQYEAVLAKSLQLQLKLHRFGEALETWDRMQKSHLDQAALAATRPVIDKLQRLRTDDTEYDVAGTLSDTGSWNLRLFKRHFRIDVSDGVVEQIKLRCDKGYVFFAFDRALVYDVASKHGNCFMELEGSPGARFTLFQS
jgi:TonB family protein